MSFVPFSKYFIKLFTAQTVQGVKKYGHHNLQCAPYLNTPADNGDVEFLTCCKHSTSGEKKFELSKR